MNVSSLITIMALLGATSCLTVKPTEPLEGTYEEGLEAYRVAALSMPDFSMRYVVVYADKEGAVVAQDFPTIPNSGCSPLACANQCTCGGLGYAVRDRTSRRLSIDEWTRLQKRIEESGFWEGTAFEERLEVMDGWDVTLEGVRGSERKKQSGRNPVGPLVNVVDTIFALVDAPPERGEGSFDPGENRIHLRGY
jgi:hypothetical protein